MSETNKQLVRRWFEEVWNQRSEAAIESMFSSKGKAHGLPEPDSVLEGHDGFKTLHRGFCAAFPDLRVTVEDTIAEGDRVAVRWSADMTHTGDGLGFPASGKKVRMNGMSVVVIKDGKIHEGWNCADMGRLFAQLKAAEAG
jgi:steroid delta-isomerase-like uncharacterized protein